MGTEHRAAQPVDPVKEVVMSEREKTEEFSGHDTRQGEIILRSPARKAIFIAGLAGIVVLSVLLTVSGCVPTP